MAYTSKALESLKRGQVLLTRVRKVNKYDNNGAVIGHKAQIEIAQFVENDTRGNNPLSVLNEGDERFYAQKPRFAWMTAEIAQLCKLLPAIKQADYDKLDVSTGRMQEAGLKAGKDYLEVNIYDPKINNERLVVQVNEQTTAPVMKNGKINDRVQPKVNPSTGQIMTHEGKPVYSLTTIVYESSCKSNFLVTDTFAAAQPGVHAPAVKEFLNID